MMIEKRSPVKTVLIYVLLIVLTIVTLLPLVWMLSASFKLSSEVFTFPIKWIPETFHWENYITIWQKINLATYTFNSFKLSIIITLIQLVTSSFAAYGFSKCRFPGRNGLFLAYIATIAIPWQVYMLPQYIMMQKMHLIDTGHHPASELHGLRRVPPQAVLHLDSGRASGGSQDRRTVGVRHIRPHRASADKAGDGHADHHELRHRVERLHGTDDLLQQRQEQDDPAVQLGIQMFTGIYSTEYGLIMATSVLAIIPVLVVFLAFQRFFVEGIASSGLKG